MVNIGSGTNFSEMWSEWRYLHFNQKNAFHYMLSAKCQLFVWAPLSWYLLVNFLSKSCCFSQATPTLVRRLIRRCGGGLLGPQSPLRILALGGEPCPKRSVMSTWKHPDNRTAMFNLYGITEVSCWATYCRVDVHYRWEETLYHILL